MAVRDGTPLDKLRGIALFNPMKDASLTALKSFDRAKQAILTLSHYSERFGAEDTRVSLQFIYEYFDRVNGVRFAETEFEKLWLDLITELQEPDWITRGVANVRNFNTATHPIDLGDGVTIRGRSPEGLAALGFNDAIWRRLREDWLDGGGQSSFVLIVESTTPKQPQNFISQDAGSISTKAARALSALRLAEAGSIGIGPMWVVRAAYFNVGIGGVLRAGASIPASVGPPYAWTEQVSREHPRIYRAMAQLEKDGYGRSPGNLSVALRAFMATYDRWPLLPDSQLLDAVTTLEALLGTEMEISFKLSYRVASLLAVDEKDRAALFKRMKEFYDTRSKVVHGAPLKPKHRNNLLQVDELRSLVRRLLRAFVMFAANPQRGYGKKFFTEQLDEVLMDAVEREKLRASLGLQLTCSAGDYQI